MALDGTSVTDGRIDGRTMPKQYPSAFQLRPINRHEKVQTVISKQLISVSFE